jgi:hypothetical protein
MKAFHGEFPKGVRYWTPSETDVLLAEKELIPFLSRSNDGRVKEILSKIKTQEAVRWCFHRWAQIHLLESVLRRTKILDAPGSCSF